MASITTNEISRNIKKSLDAVTHKRILREAYDLYDKCSPFEISPCMYKEAKRTYKIKILTYVVGRILKDKGVNVIESIKPSNKPNKPNSNSNIADAEVISIENDYL